MSQNYSYLRTILEKSWKIKTFDINIFEVENCDILLFCMILYRKLKHARRLSYIITMYLEGICRGTSIYRGFWLYGSSNSSKKRCKK